MFGNSLYPVSGWSLPQRLMLLTKLSLDVVESAYLLRESPLEGSSLGVQLSELILLVDISMAVRIWTALFGLAGACDKLRRAVIHTSRN